MEGKGPYHIYDPGGATREEAAKAFERLVEENTRLKEKMQGIKSLGELLEESHVEASKLRQKVEDLVKDNKMLQPSPFPSDELLEVTGRDPDGNMTSAEPSRSEKEQDAETRPTPLSGSSSEFEIVPTEDKRFSHESRKSDTEKPQHEDANLMLHLQRLESTLSVFAEEADRNQVLAHLGRMALEFNRLASKVHRNEQRTSVLQTLCEQLRNENEDLRAKLEKDLEQRNQVTEKLRCENQELRKMVLLRKEGAKGDGVERCSPQQSGATAEKTSGKGTSEASEKKVKILEHQRNELLEVNKQWDQHFRAMKQQYEQKITDLRHKLADAQKALGEQEVEREQKQRDFDRKLLLAKSRIEVEEAEKERLSAEVKELKQRTRFLQEQLAPVTKQREYQEKEIQRLNKALEEALSSQATAPSASAFVSTMEPGGGMHRHELLTQNELLKQQVKVFEEDFQRERSDRERMNEEKEELKQQLEKLQKQLTVSSHQLRLCKDDCQREKEEKEKLKKMLKQHKQLSGERLPPEPLPAPLGPTCPMYQFQYSPPAPHPLFHGYEDWQQIRYPPPAEHGPIQNYRHFPPPEYAWRLPPCTASRTQNSPAVDGVKPPAKDAEPAGPGGPKSPRPV
ncbi:PREDICTED: TNFAIP3-interacting protein 1 [Crocodylus porosus]|uniref:TNFAIP3-interacting protein 1 n=1 Tax=Crocodylus porosus TaxID=8502 RepID=UPI00093B590D|nr:PREDICTED: TNFAIP3-interacting protein 1 [Crocodylus porosus]XP_019390787.1 PREDICTED: TNFAIP3-interacting protein 1 [Crocodylus porosus]